ncbi:O-antigen ligase RfaL [Escherichia albertii]|uniref:O-antigen ligase RfaL n=1 Tax=Escherichia albertii TaxID=208962 RepID=UPI0016A04DF3|nr:O-antigen ligase RfaL [Escherichia albertii]MCQ8908893.1 O-antigen ligase RfaL [Escherichia albertii]MCQ8956576.1 O-antigen ligase RfaL [Escherichia albertii]MCQ8988204.1 O-antigen ligase RfaL [Escherichia albertii]UUL26754.1 O-antigen ligase RfaL [Escherichia albertii]UUL46038.1 O-antigen ligase RfaL [Escherichia albertii]
MLTASLALRNRENWKPYWNKALVFLFLTTFFLDGITRYKHIISVLMIITVIYQISRAPKTFTALYKNNLFYSVIALSLILLYAIFISPDLKISFKEFSNTVLKGFLAYSLLIPALLKDEDNESIGKIILYSLVTGLGLRCLVEIVLYIQDYNKGIMPFTTSEHRSISDSMVFLFPALLNLWFIKKTSYKIGFIIFSAIFLFLLLGTLSRGAWLAVLIVTLLWLILNRQWKLLMLTSIIITVASACVFTYKTDHIHRDRLIYKLQQTDSSYRYTNGTQGTAWTLIMENPLKGYGYGDDIYHSIYNKRVVDFPSWTFKQSIGPHNIILSIWFAAGLAGFLALLYLYGSIIKETANATFQKVAVSPYNGQLLLFLTLVGFYIIRGNFEEVDLKPIGLIVGLLLAMRNK